MSPPYGTSLTRYLSMFSFLLLLLLLLLPFSGDDTHQVSGQGPPCPTENSVIWGYVFDPDTTSLLPNMTIRVTKEHYIGNETVTNATGYYAIGLPEGSFVLRIYDEENFIIYRLDFNISEGQQKRYDIRLDARERDRSGVHGTIRHRLLLNPMIDVDVQLHRIPRQGDPFLYQSTRTDEDGYYNMSAAAGAYRLEVWSEENKLHSLELHLNYSQRKRIDLNLEDPTKEMTLENAGNLLVKEWLNLIGIIIVILIGLILLAYISKPFDALYRRIGKEPSRFIDHSIVYFIERVVKWNIIILMLIGIAYLVAQILDVQHTLWVPIRGSITSIYIIILLVIFMRISLMVWRQAIRFLRGDIERKEGKSRSPRMMTIVEIAGKYVIAFFFMLGMVLTALAALGMSDLILTGIRDGLFSNAPFLIFILTLVVVTYLITRFMSSFFSDMKGRTTRFRPEMIEITSKGVRFFVYLIIGLILVFTILSAAGLGQIGQIIIIVFSMIIGLVVSMAATGSIGNMLSGIVIMAFKPFDEDDWVIIADKYKGRVVEMNMMFTKLRDLENELIEIPNNMVLTDGVVNWSKAAQEGGFAMEINTSIGYDVPVSKVMDLMMKATKDVEGLLKDPEPHVVINDFLDHAVSYKLRAYIDTPEHYYTIRTKIMSRMHDLFYGEGLEILSPSYEVERIESLPSTDVVKRFLADLKEYKGTSIGRSDVGGRGDREGKGKDHAGRGDREGKGAEDVGTGDREAVGPEGEKEGDGPEEVEDDGPGPETEDDV